MEPGSWCPILPKRGTEGWALGRQAYEWADSWQGYSRGLPAAGRALRKYTYPSQLTGLMVLTPRGISPILARGGMKTGMEGPRPAPKHRGLYEGLAIMMMWMRWLRKGEGVIASLGRQGRMRLIYEAGSQSPE